MMCNRVLIMNQGKILADNTTANLQNIISDGSQVVAEIAAPMDELRSCWEQIGEIEYFDIAPSEGEYYRCSLMPRSGLDLRALVFEQVRLRGWLLRELSRTQHSLEDIFVHVTRSDQEDGS